MESLEDIINGIKDILYMKLIRKDENGNDAIAITCLACDASVIEPKTQSDIIHTDDCPARMILKLYHQRIDNANTRKMRIKRSV